MIERHCLIKFNYIIQSTNFPELHDAFEGGIVVVAVQSLRIKSHLQWVLKEMDTNINIQFILWPPSRLVVNSSLLYDYNSSRKSMFLVSLLISVTGNLLHSFNCMEVTTRPHWLIQILMREYEAARDGTKTT